MAVWIYAYGKNGLNPDPENYPEQILHLLNSLPLDASTIIETIQPRSFVRQYYTENRESLELQFRSMPEEAYRNYLHSIKLPYIAVDKIIDHFIEAGEKREQDNLEKYNRVYTGLKEGSLQATWKLSSPGFFVNQLSYFDENWDGIKISFINDLVRISGPFLVFSNYSSFLTDLSPRHRDYYHNYFKSILKAFGSDFILYAHEWSGMDDEDNEAFDLEELHASSNWEVNSSKTLETMDRFYYESLTP